MDMHRIKEHLAINYGSSSYSTIHNTKTWFREILKLDS